ncbi:MAG: hypothetical protein RLZZ382_1831, partial [Bacteroidota bacterium]
MKYPRILFFFVSFLWSSVVAQTIDIPLPWKAPVPVSLGEINYLVPTLGNELPSDGIPRYLFRQELKSMNFSALISSMDAVDATSDESAYLQEIGFRPSDSLDYSLKVTRAGEKSMLSFSCFPFFLENGILKKLLYVSVSLNPKAPSSLQKDFVANSVLAQGEWYKIAITSDGIHKIDKTLLTALGINTSGLNPNHIHV